MTFNIHSIAVKFFSQPVIIEIKAGDVVELVNGEKCEVRRVMISPYFVEEQQGIIRLDIKKSGWNVNRFGSGDYVLVTDIKWVLKAQQVSEFVQ